MARHLALTLERFAELRARIDRGEALGELLHDEGLSFDRWRDAERGWLELIGSESARMRFQLSQRYQQAYLAHRDDLLPPPPEPETASADLDGTAVGFHLNLDLGDALPFADAPAATPAASAPAMAPAASAPAVSTSAVSTSAAGAAAEKAAEPDEVSGDSDSVHETAFFDGIPALDLPFEPAAEPAPAEPAAPAPVVPGPVEPAPAVPMAAAMAARPPPAPVAAPPPVPVAAPPPPVPMAAPPPPVPMAAPPPAPVAAPPPPVPVAAPPPAPVAASRPAVDETVFAGEMRIDFDALPFQGAAAPPTSAVDDSARPHGDLDGTAMVSAPLLAADATPFDGDAQLPTLTVEQYASLCAELQVHPESRDASARKYGLAGAAQLARLQASWAKRHASDHALAQRHLALVAQYASWLGNQGKT